MRRVQYKFARLYMLGELTRSEAARAAEVTPWTISSWVRELLASDEPEAEGLRRIKKKR
jgi:DNA-binding XRE family transcriptional regulator